MISSSFLIIEIGTYIILGTIVFFVLWPFLARIFKRKPTMDVYEVARVIADKRDLERENGELRRHISERDRRISELEKKNKVLEEQLKKLNAKLDLHNEIFLKTGVQLGLTQEQLKKLLGE